MFKKIMKVMLCFVLILGLTGMAFAKKESSEEKTGAKDKISLGYDIVNNEGSMRMWLTNSLGLDLKAGLNFTSAGSGAFGFNLGGNMVFQIMHNNDVGLYLTPGISLALASVTNGASTFTFAFGSGLEAEAFIVRDVLSVAGSFGINLGIESVSVGGNSTTSFIFNLGTSPIGLTVRYYL